MEGKEGKNDQENLFLLRWMHAYNVVSLPLLSFCLHYSPWNESDLKPLQSHPVPQWKVKFSASKFEFPQAFLGIVTTALFPNQVQISSVMGLLNWIWNSKTLMLLIDFYFFYWTLELDWKNRQMTQRIYFIYLSISISPNNKLV